MKTLIAMMMTLSVLAPAAFGQIDVERSNRIVFAVADGTLIAGAISTLSAQGDRGKRNLGYLLILAGVATLAANQGVLYSLYGETNWNFAYNFNRDCRMNERYPDIEAPSGLASLAEGIDAFAGQDTHARIQGTCSLYRKVMSRSAAMKAGGSTPHYTAELGEEIVGKKGLSASDQNILRNLFFIGGVTS